MSGTDIGEMRIQKRIDEASLKARLVELDLLEQAINRYGDMTVAELNAYKLQRLDDITARLKALWCGSEGRS